MGKSGKKLAYEGSIFHRIIPQVRHTAARPPQLTPPPQRLHAAVARQGLAPGARREEPAALQLDKGQCLDRTIWSRKTQRLSTHNTIRRAVPGCADSPQPTSRHMVMRGAAETADIRLCGNGAAALVTACVLCIPAVHAPGRRLHTRQRRRR